MLSKKGVDTRKDALVDLVSISLEKTLTPKNILGRFPVGMDLGILPFDSMKIDNKMVPGES